MDDEREVPPAGDTGQRARAVPAETPTRPPRRSRLGLKLVGIFVVLPILLFAAWTAGSLSWVYSRGERAGYIQKFSQKGWICKTWEGELAMQNMPGVAPELFPFSVRSDSIAHAITSLMGSRVALSYEQHRGVPGHCFAETEYFITAVKKVDAP